MQDGKLTPQEGEGVPKNFPFYEDLTTVPHSPHEKEKDSEECVAANHAEKTDALPLPEIQGTETQDDTTDTTSTKPDSFEIPAQISKDEALHPDNQNIGNLQDTKANLPKTAFFGKFILIVGITSCVVILFTVLINKTRQEKFHMIEMKNVLERQMKQFEMDNSRLEKEYVALKNDPVRIEKEAREQLGFVNPDEIIYPRYNFRIKHMVKPEPAEGPPGGWKDFIFEGQIRWQIPALLILITSALYLISYHYEYRKLHKSNR